MEGGVGALANKTHKLTVDTGVEINMGKGHDQYFKEFVLSKKNYSKIKFN